jgi:hypothetical protein
MESPRATPFSKRTFTAGALEIDLAGGILLREFRHQRFPVARLLAVVGAGAHADRDGAGHARREIPPRLALHRERHAHLHGPALEVVVAAALVEPALQEHVVARAVEMDGLLRAVEAHSAVAGAAQQLRLPDVEHHAIVLEGEMHARLLQLDAVAQARPLGIRLDLAAHPFQVREGLPRELLVAEDEFRRLLGGALVAHVLQRLAPVEAIRGDLGVEHRLVAAHRHRAAAVACILPSVSWTSSRWMSSPSSRTSAVISSGAVFARSTPTKANTSSSEPVASSPSRHGRACRRG